MDFLNDIRKETLIICNKECKNKIIQRNKLLPIKIMDMEEFMRMYLFSYDDKAIIYIMNKYNIKYEVALIYIKNLYYINKDNYGIKKLDFLCQIKKELLDNGLLKENSLFREYVKNIDIVIYGMRLDKFYINLFKELNYKVIDREYQNYQHLIYSFETMEDEVYYVAHQICLLIDKGIDINKIKLCNVDKEYYNTIERIFSLMGLKVNISYKTLLSSYPMVNRFIDLYKKTDLTEALNSIDNDDPNYDRIIDIINDYIKYDNKELIIYKLEHCYITNNKYSNGIEIIDYMNYISNDDEYIFMLSFNDTVIPNSYKDINYITDNICNYLELDSTRVKNEYLREDIIKAIKDIKNLVITYKNRDLKKNYYPSTLCSYFKVISGNINEKISYSETYNKLRLGIYIDNYMKYGYKDNLLDILYNNYSIEYNSFSNKFTGINRVCDKLRLSYSKMQIYNKCAFRYYLSDILKLDIFDENFSTVIGSLVHFVMEKCLSNNEMDVEKYVKIFLGERTFTNKERFFLDKYIEAIHELINQVMLEKEYSLFNQAMYEKKIDIDFGNNVSFVGIIDKVLYYVDNDITYVSLIDYKTGNDPISLKYLQYGLNIQLPIYLYLSTKMDFKKVFYTGFYLQKFNITDKDYRLVGYSNSDKSILAYGDKGYDNSKIIKGMKTLKDGTFSRYTKVLSNDDINKIIEITERKILEVIDNIKKNQFSINPKVSEGKNIGCEFCKFKDICFVTSQDKVEIKKEEFGGEE